MTDRPQEIQRRLPLLDAATEMPLYPRNEMRICFVGDSFVNGVGDPACLGWTGRLCAEAGRAGYDITCYNLGVRRDTSADIARRWRAEVACRLPDECDGRVVLSFGVNDTTIEDGRRRVSLDATLTNAQAILHEARTLYPLLVVGPPPVADTVQNERIRALSFSLGQLCAREGVPYLETCKALLARPVWLREVAAGDGAHPGAAGYEALAQIVRAWSGWAAWFA